MIDPILITTIIILLMCFLGLSWFAGSDAPYIPTKADRLDQLFKLIKIKKGQVFYELGSGDGRVVFEAARQGALAIGIEQSWIRVLSSRRQARKLGLANCKSIHGDIFKREYKDADIVFIYLLTPAVLKLETKLKKELKKGSIIITQTYHFKNWQPVKKRGSFWIYEI